MLNNILFNGHTYRVAFKHYTESKMHPGTTCAVQQMLNPNRAEGEKSLWIAVAAGSTRRNPLDTLNRPVGRELSLTRALRHVEKGLRNEILRMYYGRKKRARSVIPEWAKAKILRERLLWTQ